MCRNIKTLANFEPPATSDEIRASALQFVRKLSGMNRPSRANQQAFDRAVDDVTAAAHRLVHSIETSAPPRNQGRGAFESSGALAAAIRRCCSEPEMNSKADIRNVVLKELPVR